MPTDDKVEDLVKAAIKVALKKRSGAEEVAGVVDIQEEVTPPPKVTKSKPILEDVEGYLPCSKILKQDVENDFLVRVFKQDDWNEAVATFIPDTSPSYHVVKDQAEAILRAWELNEKVLMYGPTGAGKSSLVEHLCALTNRPFVRVNCTGDMDSSMIFGQLTAKDGSTIWMDGTVTEAVKHGAVFAWDEWDVTPPEISMGLQWLLEDEGKLFLKEMPGTSKDKFIVPHKDFRLVAIGNTQGQGDETGNHAGTNVQNSATLDRFGTTIKVGYLPEQVEVEMLAAKTTGIAKQDLTDLVKLANLVRQGYTSGQLSLTMSPRALLSITKKMAYGCQLKAATELVYLNKLSETQQKVASELYRKVFGTR